MTAIVLIAIAGCALAVFGAFLDLGKQNRWSEADMTQPEHVRLVEMVTSDFGNGLTALVSQANLDDVEAWTAGETRPNAEQVLRLSVALAAFHIVLQAEGSKELARLWMAGAEVPGEGPIDQLHKGAFDRVIAAAEELAVAG